MSASIELDELGGGFNWLTRSSLQSHMREIGGVGLHPLDDRMNRGMPSLFCPPSPAQLFRGPHASAPRAQLSQPSWTASEPV